MRCCDDVGDLDGVGVWFANIQRIFLNTVHFLAYLGKMKSVIGWMLPLRVETSAPNQLSMLFQWFVDVYQTLRASVMSDGLKKMGVGMDIFFTTTFLGVDNALP